jgi:hypothetical protein
MNLPLDTTAPAISTTTSKTISGSPELKPYSVHRIDSLRKLGTARLVDAAGIYPSPLKAILPAFSTKVLNLDIAGLARDIRGMKLLQRYLFGSPGVREDNIGRPLGVDELSELQGIEVEEAHLVAG